MKTCNACSSGRRATFQLVGATLATRTIGRKGSRLRDWEAKEKERNRGLELMRCVPVASVSECGLFVLSVQR